MANKIFVAIAGNIGTGKTTLAQLLAERYAWQANFEAVDNNPYLRDFYQDMARWSFPLQIFFLNHRFKVHKNIITNSASAIQDRSIYEDAHIFARNLFETGKLEKRDYFNYLDLYTQMIEYLPPPDIIIYLRKSIPRLLEQIKKRGRDFEANIPVDYLVCLNRYYDEWIEKYSLGKVLVIESDNLDFLAREEDFQSITKRLMSKLDQQELFGLTPTRDHLNIYNL